MLVFFFKDAKSHPNFLTSTPSYGQDEPGANKYQLLNPFTHTALLGIHTGFVFFRPNTKHTSYQIQV